MAKKKSQVCLCSRWQRLLAMLLFPLCAAEGHAQSSFAHSLSLNNGERASISIELAQNQVAVLQLEESQLSAEYRFAHSPETTFNRCFDRGFLNHRRLLVTPEQCLTCSLEVTAWVAGTAAGDLSYTITYLDRDKHTEAWTAETTYEQACRDMDSGQLKPGREFIEATDDYWQYLQASGYDQRFWSFLLQRASFFKTSLDQPFGKQLFEQAQQLAVEHAHSETLVYLKLARAQWEFSGDNRAASKKLLDELEQSIINEHCCSKVLIQNKLKGLLYLAWAGYYITYYEYELSKRYYQDAIRLFANESDADSLINALNGIGFQYRSFRQLPEALKYHGEAAELLNKTSASAYSIVETLYYLGVVSAISGRYFHALELLESAAEQAEKNSLLLLYGFITASKARVNKDLGQYDIAEHIYDEVIRVYSEANAVTDLPTPYVHLADIYAQTGRLTEAKIATSTARKIIGTNMDPLHERWLTRAETNILLREGNPQAAARRYLTRIARLESSASTDDEFALGRAYSELARIYLENRAFKQALRFADLALSEHVQVNDDVVTVTSYLVAAKAALEMGYSQEDILKYTEPALELIEAIRNAMHSDSLKQQYFSLQRQLFDVKVELNQQVSSKGEIKPITTAEQYKARTLYDALLKNGSSGVENSRRVRSDLTASNTEVEQGIAVKNYLDRLFAEEVSAERHRTHSVLADTELQAYLSRLTRQQFLVYFYQSPENMYVWAANQTEIRSHKLALTDDIQQLVSRVIGTRDIENTNQPGRQGLSDYDAMSRLSKALLNPFADMFVAGKPILVIPDGFMHQIPFAALPEPASGVRFVANHPISYQVSLSTDQWLSSNRNTNLSAGQLMLVGNPRLPMELTKKASARRLGLRNSYAPLPYAETEVRKIRNLWPANDNAIALIGTNATKNAFKSHAGKAYQVLHLAAHVEVNWDFPQLSAILLAQDTANDSNDFRLTSAEISELAMPSELVVLSACDSASGKHIAGEGPLGLSRAFIEAGSKRVIASIWPVEDEATSYFFEAFYRILIEEKVQPHIALQKAQIYLSQIPRWSHPYYWAPFVFIGKREGWELKTARDLPVASATQN